MADIKLDNVKIAKMSLEANRLSSFQNWPFQDDERNNICTAEKMAQAGFYSCNNDQSPDLVRCYVCFKELEGWEPHDDPWSEHLKHSANCSFAKKGKPEGKLTVEEFVKMEMESQQNRIEILMNEKVKHVESWSDHVLDELMKLGSK
ncbi:baculoviral IAP repeat-containing protein 5.2-like [Dendronephthya gigantea]|uniref:baculoviral IAP repeat-containing protein 5.2-like n=1 Tax=Dendronephthya gigantea TaxID=151771 RepID=UPI00106A4C9B|nr:baculoviral IAP repeat-containing protein 5.2-like [Dendronephthya gigantea]